jgi:hypothetical protein
VGKGSDNAALVEKIGPWRRPCHAEHWHLVHSVGLLQQGRQSLNAGRQGSVEARDRGNTGRRLFVYPIHGRVVCPDSSRVESPGIFERAVLRRSRAVRDSVIIKSVSQSLRSGEVGPAPAVAAVDALLIVDLVVNLDVELVIRRTRCTGEIVVVEFSREIRLRIKIR